MMEPAYVIVRHGNTFGEGQTPRRIGARTDLPLTAAGLAQAQALGAHFAALGWHFARALVSPLTRTRLTAQAILEHQPEACSAEPCDWLQEIDHGPDEGMPETAVLARIGTGAIDAWDARAEPPPGWIVETQARGRAWRVFFATPQPEPVLLVTSNGAARFAVLADPALVALAPPNLKLPTGGYGVIRRCENGTLEIPVWGRRP